MVDDSTTPGSAATAAPAWRLYASGFIRGVIDSLQIPVFLSYCLRTNDVWIPTAKCMAMNVTLVLTMAFFASISAGTGLEWVVLVSWQIPLRITTDVFGFYGWSLYPSMFYAAQEEKYRRRKTAPRRIVHSPAYVGEKALRTLMQVAATLMKVVIGFLPALALWLAQSAANAANVAAAGTAAGWLVSVVDWGLVWPICFVLDALVYSFFCFECRLEQQGLVDKTAPNTTKAFRLSELLGLFETCWTYYLGYGFIQHVGQRALVLMGQPLLASCLYAALMPVNVVTSLDASPGPSLPTRLPLFSRLCLDLGRRYANATGAGVRGAAALAASNASASAADE